MATQTLSQQLAEALSSLSATNTPHAVLHAAKRALLDAVGAGLAGVHTLEAETVWRAVKAWGNGPATAWGRGVCLALPHAALLNGTAVHAREVDDFGGCGHSGAVVVPAVLAAAESVCASGLDLLLGIVAGYEAAARVTDLVGGYAAHNAAGWHGTGTCGVFGAAASAGSLLGLSAPQMAHALGLAGTYTGGIWSFIADGAMSKRLHAGKAAETGLSAALLAREGLTGPSHVFESDWGSFASLYGGEISRPDALLSGFGQEWAIFRSGFKPYACCRGCHGVLDAVLEMRLKHDLSANEVAQVIIKGSEQTAQQLGKQDVRNVLDAQMSLPYSVAVALTAGRADLEHYQLPYLAASDILDLARRISVVADSSQPLGSQPMVELQLMGGDVLRGSVAHPKGEAANPLSDEELEDKYLSLASMTVARQRAEQIRDAIWNIDRQSSVRELIALLGG